MARAEPCAWTSAGAQAFAGSRSLHTGGVNALMGDGSMRFLNESINHTIWIALNPGALAPPVDQAASPNVMAVRECAVWAAEWSFANRSRADSQTPEARSSRADPNNRHQDGPARNVVRTPSGIRQIGAGATV
jgi:prepilin-type processing-associated H-X9-DG protein